ncbi:GNAT family N-acetyltransferase [Piscinibacter sp. XHJ-5]|uniref:GNAT family N-acetyltransferase n=1 Tax=Piscinibacter sp. XHJ-5 TaxID=3037797 RepID=UPI0024537179|nr:GNAT family N-acetyltransferase [Piscinibacter sp. XHJ-5]
MNIVGPALHREQEIEAILRSLPRWFGIEHALLMYVADSASRPTLAVELDHRLQGFVTLTRHFPESWEIHCIAVASEHRNSGIGSVLLAHAERFARDQGARFLQVKTVAATSASLAYAETRKFYEAKGFTPLEVFPELWNPRNPALQLIKVLLD